MKDKLVKFNHKKPYYLFRRILFSSFLIASAFIIISVPTYISINSVHETFINNNDANLLKNVDEINLNSESF